MENTTFDIKKSRIEVYYLRPEGHHCGWADISIDEGDKSGRISISSDYGNWAYYWGACGSSFKEFLCGLDIHYAAGKFGTGNHFDAEATLRATRMDILRARHQESIESEEARELWDFVYEIEDCRSSESFATLVYNSDLMKLYDCGPDIVTTIDPGFKRFWDTTWQSFVHQLKKETELQTEAIESH